MLIAVRPIEYGEYNNDFINDGVNNSFREIFMCDVVLPFNNTYRVGMVKMVVDRIPIIKGGIIVFKNFIVFFLVIIGLVFMYWYIV